MTTKFNATLAKLGRLPAAENLTAETVAAAFENAYGANLLSVAKALFSTKRPDNYVLKILPKLYKLLELLYPNNATLSVKLSEIRKVIKAKQSPEVGKKSNLSEYFNLPANARAALRSAYDQKVQSSNNNLSQVSVSDLKNAIVQLSDRAKREDASGVYAKGVLLMLCSGMRPIELFQNTVRAIDDRHALFGKLAKKRPGTAGMTVERPIIGQTADEFVRTLGEFRRAFADKQIFKETAIVPNINRGLNKAARAVFPELIDSAAAASMMRKYYTILAYELFADKERTNFNTYIQGLLGHDSIQTSFAYSTINLTGTEEEKQEAANLNILARSNPTAGGSLPFFEKISRRAPLADKIALLDQIYRSDPQLSNADLRRISGCGSRIVNDFLKEHRLVIDESIFAEDA